MGKKYEELEFTDNFMFVKILSSDLELCKDLLELILQTKINRLELAGYEKTILPTYESKGIRFDVYVADDEETVFDVEMQANPDPEIAKRSRYYHSTMDIEQLLAGEAYEELKKSFVIFICKRKIADDYDKPIYTFRMQSREDPGKYLEDGAWTVLVNAQCKDEYLSGEMLNFMHFIRTGIIEEPSDDLPNRLNNAVTEAKETKKWSAEYMRWEDELNHRYYIGHKEGLEEGIALGIEQGKSQILLQLYENGMPIEDIAKFNQHSVEEVQKMINNMAGQK